MAETKVKEHSKQSAVSAIKEYETRAMLQYYISKYPGKIVLASSMAAEDQVLTDIACKLNGDVKILTLDTGRLPQETYDVIEATQARYGITINVLLPDGQAVEDMTGQHGMNLFYDSIENRKLCCRIRKIEPLKRGLKDMKAWICGLRKEQSITRDLAKKMQWDEQFGLIKLSPLLEWTTKDVWDYIHRHDVPYNALHDKGYPSIGCEPCTRAIGEDEDLRAGRWWWELPEHKECGLHNNPKTNSSSAKKDEK